MSVSKTKFFTTCISDKHMRTHDNVTIHPNSNIEGVEIIWKENINNYTPKNHDPIEEGIKMANDWMNEKPPM